MFKRENAIYAYISVCVTLKNGIIKGNQITNLENNVISIKIFWCLLILWDLFSYF